MHTNYIVKPVNNSRWAWIGVCNICPKAEYDKLKTGCTKEMRERTYEYIVDFFLCAVTKSRSP